MKLLYNIAGVIITGAIVGPFTWMLIDRDAPYIRENGEIVAVDHRFCGLLSGPPDDGILRPGSCVSVMWKITPRRICKPYSPFNVTRVIIDQQGRHVLPPTHSVYSASHSTLPPSRDGDIVRYFPLPLNSPVGPAEYESSASFACNKLQEFFWPVVVNEPSIKFMVGDPMQGRGPR